MWSTPSVVLGPLDAKLLAAVMALEHEIRIQCVSVGEQFDIECGTSGACRYATLVLQSKYLFTFPAGQRLPCGKTSLSFCAKDIHSSRSRPGPDKAR
jgi:hypothetical protein